ncbi:MAG: NAD(P)(+) transhydrogenase (Re/Si-specific) subunit beta [Pirellulaceae bacterium]|nr:NAD(P)(+) transhydrogenase (Re/Si-specific) subunit beta [Pirellulaceae bacterium]
MDSTWQLLIDGLIILILIIGMWRFSSPERAASGNALAALGLLLALGVVWFSHTIQERALVVAAILAGAAAGGSVAWRVNMLQIPAMVAFQHGAGSLAACITSFVELTRDRVEWVAVSRISGILGLIVGAAAFSGSIVAGVKLAGLARQTPTVLPQHGRVHAALVASVAVCGGVAWCCAGSALLGVALLLVGLAILWGVVFAMRVGGADMPVLISFLNAATGLAAALCGVTIQNRLLIACGAFVAASGTVLTHAMCVAMNRHVFRVFTGTAAAPNAAPAAVTDVPPPVGTTGVPEKVIVIPGYGMALAHAQFEAAQLARRLQDLGREVRFAIHPIAGRMPGHMHVLLAEAEVDSDLLFDLPEINDQFAQTDLVLIVGACDVVNPAAIHAKGTPISGMPILAAHEARQVIVCNLEKTILLLGDAKATLGDLLARLDGST